MPINITDVQNAIGSVIKNLPELNSAGNRIEFTLTDAECCTCVNVTLSQKYDPGVDDNAQIIELEFVLADEDGDVADFQDKPYYELLEICNDLQVGQLEWSSISARKLADGTVEISLYRACNANREDLDKTVKEMASAELLTGFCALFGEIHEIGPLLLDYLSGEKPAEEIKFEIMQRGSQAVM